VDESYRRAALTAIANAPADLPIATGDGLRYFEAMEALPPDISRRLVLLTVPDAASTDPSNQHEALRWAAIRPDRIRLEDAGAFLCRTSEFLLFVDDTQHDDLPSWLKARSVRLRWLGQGKPRFALASGPRCTVESQEPSRAANRGSS
jgi:hypothetical protein